MSGLEFMLRPGLLFVYGGLLLLILASLFVWRNPLFHSRPTARGAFLVAAFALGVGAEAVGAQATPTPTPDFTCPGRAIVRVVPGAEPFKGPALNIRQTAQGAVPGNAILGTLRFEDGEKVVIAESNGYLRLQAGGWIWNRYLTIVCATPAPLPTATPTPTKTPSPGPSPTRIAENPRGGMWVRFGRGPRFWVDFATDCTETPGRTRLCVLEIEIVP